MNKVLKNKKAIFIFTSPAVIFLVILVFIPIIMSIGFSLTNWKYGGEVKFVGLKNYLDLFTFNGGVFIEAAVNSLKITIASVIFMIPLSFLIGALLGSGIKGERPFVTVFFIPMVISATVIGQLWLKIYNYDYGILNTILRAVHLEGLVQDWLGNKNLALNSVIFTFIWQNFPYYMLLFYASVKGISTEVLESAALDGATGVKRMYYIILPMVKPMTEVCVTLAVINSFKVYDIIISMTNGGPMGATEVPSTLMVKALFGSYYYGRGSAYAIFIVLECLVCTLLIKRLMREKE